MAAAECIFCKIVAGTAQCHELYRDETTLAFMDIHPANEGHCLMISRAHFATLFELPPQSFAAVGATVAKLARAVNETLQPGGLSLVQTVKSPGRRCHMFTCMFCRGAQETIFSSTGIVTALGILCMPIPFISLLLPGARKGSSETDPGRSAQRPSARGLAQKAKTLVKESRARLTPGLGVWRTAARYTRLTNATTSRPRNLEISLASGSVTGAGQ